MADSRHYRDPRELRVVLLGKTGSGKSALGNLLLDKNAFESKMTSSSVTSFCEKSTATIPMGDKIVVVDTPGLYDTKMTIFQTMREIVRCMDMTKPGPHLFILVLRIGRTTDEELNTIKICKKRFGEQLMKHVLIAFTCTDNLDEETTIIDFVRSARDEMKGILQECCHRYIGVNNRLTGSDRVTERNNAIAKIREIIDQNGRFYEFAFFKAAEDEVQKIVKEMETKKMLLSNKLKELKKKRGDNLSEENKKKKEDLENKLRELEGVDNEDEIRNRILMKALEEELKEFEKITKKGSCCTIL